MTSRLVGRRRPAQLLVAWCSIAILPPSASAQDPLPSGGELRADQACYDVQHYGLKLRVDPATRSIEGSLTMRAITTSATQRFALDLDERLAVRGVAIDGQAQTGYSAEDGRIEIEFDAPREAEREFVVTVRYGGEPFVAPNPPWRGGFTWAETRDGKPWIATSCQGEGADLWWPCKDHPSDEADSMDITIAVPAPLVVASNGRLLGVDEGADGWRTYRWHVSTPINNYAVALNIAPYETITRDYQSVAGDVFPVTYWVLPENLERGRQLFEEILKHLRFHEETFGPYPFRADKYGVAETPHLGMEHQTIIAYGNRYKGNIWGPKKFAFDSLHHHELAHEWWGNLVTARSWEDMWLHEGFGTYSQALYVERLYGAEGYREQMAYYASGLANKGPVAPRRTMNSREVYFGHEGDSPGGDIYNKGACVLHTLRFLLGDEPFFRVLRRMAYPDPALERSTDGSACRFSTTDELLAIAERESGRELDWFFELYLRQPALPELRHEVVEGELRLSWQTPAGLSFPMPVPVRLGGETHLVQMTGGTGAPGSSGSLALEGREFDLDPEAWILRQGT